MKSNVNVFIAVILVAVLCGGIVWMQSADDEKVGWNIHDAYGDAPAFTGGAAYTNATFAGPSAGEGGVMTLSPSRSLGRGMSSSHAGAYAISYSVSPAPLTSNLSPLTYGGAGGGQGLYTTSSQTFNSYGGGGNGGAAMGGAMRGSSSPNSLIASSPITSISSPIAYSTARRGDMTTAAGENPAQMVAENPVVAMTNAANAGVGNGFYGGYSAMDYSGSVNYGQYTSMFGGGRSNVRGRQNALGFNDSWWKWFDTWVQENGSGYLGEDGYYFSRSTLQEVYDQFVTLFWNSGMGDPPSFDEWLDWYQSAMGENGFYEYGDSNRKYYWVPVGDILPLLLIALLYVLFVAIKSNALKSLIKTERSE